MRKAEQKKIEDDAEGIERYQSDKYLFEYWLQIHVLSIKYGNWQSISCNEITKVCLHLILYSSRLVFYKGIYKCSFINYWLYHTCTSYIEIIYLNEQSYLFTFMNAWYNALDIWNFLHCHWILRVPRGKIFPFRLCWYLCVCDHTQTYLVISIKSPLLFATLAC